MIPWGNCVVVTWKSVVSDTLHETISFQIEDGEIFASINQKDGMVCFHDNPEKYNNPAMLHNIDQEVRLYEFTAFGVPTEEPLSSESCWEKPA